MKAGAYARVGRMRLSSAYNLIWLVRTLPTERSKGQKTLAEAFPSDGGWQDGRILSGLSRNS